MVITGRTRNALALNGLESSNLSVSAILPLHSQGLFFTKPGEHTLASYLLASSGALAQLVAHHTGSVGVTGSSPVCSTRENTRSYANGVRSGIFIKATQHDPRLTHLMHRGRAVLP